MARRWSAWVLGLAIAVLLAGGCQRQAGLAAGSSGEALAAAPREGFVYLAQLAPLHPLYPELERLDRMIETVRGAQPEGLEPPPGVPDWARPQALGSGPVFVWPQERWQERRTRRQGAAEAAGPAEDTLPDDLQAGLAWRRRQATREMEQELIQARSDLSGELADKAVKWTVEAQERLGGASGGSGSPTEEAVRAEVDARIEDLRRSHEEYLRDLERSRREVMEEQISAARDAALRAARARRRAPAGLAGDELLDTVREALQPTDVTDWPSQVDLSWPPVTLPAPPEADRPAPDAAWLAHRDTTAADLVLTRNKLQDQIMAATELAAERVARREGVRLHLSPRGQDDSNLTAQVGNALRGLWSK